MSVLQLYRVTWYSSKIENKYDKDTFEFIADKESAWGLWYELTEKCKYQFVEVTRMNGMKCHPEKGLLEM